MNRLKYILLLFIIVACKNEQKSEKLDNSNAVIEKQKELATASKNFQLLQGSWQNTLDTLSVIKMNGDILTNYYSGILSGPGVKVTLSDRCIETPDPSKISEEDKYISISESNECYYISVLDEENLSLQYNKGAIDLNFKRL